jgi:hypothetical protein
MFAKCKSLIIIMCLFLIPAVGYSDDISLSGNDILLIENETYIQNGNITIMGNAKLILNNAVLILNLTYHEEFMIYVSGSGAIESTSSVVKTPIQNEIVVIDMSESSTIKFNDSNQNDGLVYIVLSSNFTGNAEITGSVVQDITFSLTPSGGFTVEIIDTNCNGLTLRFSDNYQGEFSNLKPGLFDNWSYLQNDYDIQIINSTFNNSIVVACDGPANVTFVNSTIHQFASNAPKSAVTMTAIDSTIREIPFHGLSDITASFSDLNSGYYENWRLSEHSTGYMPEVVLINTLVTDGWMVNGFGANISVANSDVTLRSYFTPNNFTPNNFIITNSTVSELMLYATSQSVFDFDNTTIERLNVYVPPNDMLITGNLIFTEDAYISNWYGPSTIKRNYPIIMDQDMAIIQGVNLYLYSPEGSLIWSGETDENGQSNFDIEFNDDNYSDFWSLKAEYGNNSIVNEISLISSTPVTLNVDEPSTSNTITIESDFSFTIPDAIYTSVSGVINLWADFNFFGEQSDKLLWELENYGTTTSTGNPITINSDLSFSFDATFGDMDLTVNFKYFGEQSGKLLWELDSYTQ